MDFKEIECNDVEWTELAQDSFQYWAFVVVTDLYVTSSLVHRLLNPFHIVHKISDFKTLTFLVYVYLVSVEAYFVTY